MRIYRDYLNVVFKRLRLFKKVYSGKKTNTEGIQSYPFDRLAALGLINVAVQTKLEKNVLKRNTNKLVSLTKIGGKFYQTINT